MKLGVLNPAGASVADFAVTLASPVPIAVNAAKRQEHRRMLLRWGMSMSVPPKGHRFFQSAMDDGLKSEVLCVSKLGWAKIIPIAEQKIFKAG